MNAQSISLPGPNPQTRSTTNAGGGLQNYTVSLSLAILLLLAGSLWYVRVAQPFRPADGLGYWLGIIGGSLMALLLLYPLRKRIRVLQRLGKLKYWFLFHMLAGIVGPLSILYHSGTHVGSFNAAIALYSMLLVVASGVVGRFIYRKIHHGLFGSRASLKEVQAQFSMHWTELKVELQDMPGVIAQIDAFVAEAARIPSGPLDSIGHFFALGWRRLSASRQIRQSLRAHPSEFRNRGFSQQQNLDTLGDTLQEVLSAAQRAAQFSTYERLFALWHVIHIPFLWMLVITAIIHVVAVHAY